LQNTVSGVLVKPVAGLLPMSSSWVFVLLFHTL